jgi:NADH-quinone oxidoreductase subunit K
MPVPLSWYLVLSAALFAIGTLGVLLRRNAILVFLAVELMLNAVNLTFVAVARHLGRLDGQAIVVLVILVAAAEVAIGLSIIIAMYKKHRTVQVDDLNALKW